MQRKINLRDLAKKLSISHNTVYSWFARNQVPSKHCIAIEEFTGGELTRYGLRPDVFGTKPANFFPVLVSLQDLTTYLEGVGKPVSLITNNLHPVEFDPHKASYYDAEAVYNLLFGLSVSLESAPREQNMRRFREAEIEREAEDLDFSIANAQLQSS